MKIHGIRLEFPLWGKDTKELLEEFVELGFKAILVSLKEACLDKSFAGRIIDDQFISDLPADVDPCGENGEFHTFVFDGPIFNHPVPFEVGEILYREYDAPSSNTDDEPEEATADKIGFWFCDLVPV